MIPDGVLIARAQFAFAIGYHIPVSGLCSALQRDVVGCVVITAYPGVRRIGTTVILPMILGYLGYAHWVFRGKTSPGSGYGC